MTTPSATQNEIWSHVQRGLVYPSPHAIYAIFRRRGAAFAKDDLRALLNDLRGEIHKHMGSAHTSATAGVGFALWREWCAADGTPVPDGMRMDFADGDSSTVFPRSNGTFADSGGDLWFHIKSDDPEHCARAYEFIETRLRPACDVVVAQPAARKKPSPGNPGGKVIGCRFAENLNNATDPLSLENHVIVQNEPHRGASFVLAQRFRLEWDHILNMTPDQIEDLVGRTTDDILIPTDDTRSHIKCARVQSGAGDTMQILRLSLPYGSSPALRNTDLRAKGASLRDEEGIFFAAYANSVRVFETIMHNQIGAENGLMRDRLLSEARSDAGGFFYAPSQDELGLEDVEIPKGKKADPTRFPGVDWSLLDRHFDQRSTNGYMFYNHKDYLYAMTTATGDDRKRLDPPSQRVLELLANAFSRWQDNWYFNRKQQELHHLCYYVARKYGAAKAEEVMNLSVAERMGWTVKVSLGDVFASHEYGFRGRKQDEHGNSFNGADTYRIHPRELIVGALPNLGLGQGRYNIDYARKDEKMPNFFAGLSFASGVGHTVPAFQRVLDKGIGGMLAEVESQRDTATEPAKREFYAGVALALEGVRDHCLAYARLAAEMAPAAETEEDRASLAAIEARMTRLATEKPDTMLEAAQAIFTMHAALHLIGEPTAIGRLDQLLAPFYEADVKAGRIDAAQAQEIIDCFWIKVGEKVQLNRMMVEDHQPFGNLAMGGASGNYPQGGANNQWIQQVTVGGTVADDASGDGRPAYNDITLFCIRAARRLPLNAPCLSLRTRRDMPEEVLREAALALLSGGAHPILLSDEKVIPGLVASGDHRYSVPVPVRVARDYACDGCYEPQLSGVSWFTLGGLTTPQVLEATLNQGKAWASAGPIWFRGQRISFTSKPPSEIKSFDDLVDLFFEHLRWMWAKQADGTIGGFARMQAVCPSPLLSALTEGCLEKGLDYYGGGPLFNVIAPGFTGLSTTIDSLWAIKTMVFDPVTAVTSLQHLVDALLCNWGENMNEPFASSLEGPGRITARAERFRRLRNTAMHVPKFGRGNEEVDRFGAEIFRRVAETARRVITDPEPATAKKIEALSVSLATPDHPFGGFQIQPGVGTFENYVEFGSFCGASADGRHSGDTLASDLSPSPTFSDLPPDEQAVSFLTALGAYGPETDLYSDGAPTDFNIREAFSADALVKCLRAFADGGGSNILTVTCADPDTMAKAATDPEKYDVLRVRMGGWSEFFVAMFPAHQEQHQRRVTVS